MENGFSLIKSKPFHKDTGEEIKIGRLEKMSKSKKNVVDPTDIINEYSADTARLLLLSDSPPERDLEWTTSGVEGSFKYLNKIYDFISSLEDNGITGDNDQAMYKIHSTVSEMTHDLERFHLNRAIARIRELTNYLEDNKKTVPYAILLSGVKIALQLLNPFVPHVTEELWSVLGNEIQLIDTPWPKADEKYLQKSVVTVAVQLNGKMRGTVEVAANSNQKEVEDAAKELNNVIEQISGKEIVKVIYVPNKIINLICK